MGHRGARLAEMGVEPAARNSGKRRDRSHLSRQIQRQDVFRAAGAPSSKCLLLYPDGIPPDGKVEELDKYDLSALHSAVSAGEPLNREVIDVFRKHFGIKVRDGYGQTEAPC